MDVSFLSAVYKAIIVHNLIAVWKFTCLQAYMSLVVTGYREVVEGGGVIHLHDRLLQLRF